MKTATVKQIKELIKLLDPKVTCSTKGLIVDLIRKRGL